MVHILNRFKVSDFDKWKAVFDHAADFRKASGGMGGHLFRNAADRSEVVILLEWEDAGKAMKFGQSEELRRFQAEAGVIGRPDILILEDVEKLKV